MQERGGEHRARVPGRDDGVGVTGTESAAGTDEGGVRLGADGLGRLLVHLQHALADDVLETASVESGRAEEHGTDQIRRSLDRAGHDLVGRAVASQSVDRDPDRHSGATARGRGAGRLRGPGTSGRSGRRDAAASADHTSGRD